MQIKDSGSNYQFYEKNLNASIPTSVFDRSYINSFTAREGTLVPYWWDYTIMGDRFKKSTECLCEVVNPPIVPLMSRQRIFFHDYWLSFTQLWKQAQIFFDKGHSQNQFETASEIKIPTIKLAKWKRGSLADMLNFNFVNADTDGYFECNALKFMAYIRIWRDMYLNKKIFCKHLERCINGDYTLDNPLYEAGSEEHGNEHLTQEQVTKIYNFLFPLDDSDFRIGTPQWNDLKDDDEIIQWLFGEVRYRDYVDDYFTSATLEPIFGEIPTINGTILGDTLFERVQGIGGTEGKSNLTSIIGMLGYGTNTNGTLTQKQLGLFGYGFEGNSISPTNTSSSSDHLFRFGKSNATNGQATLVVHGNTTASQNPGFSQTVTDNSKIQDTNATYNDFIEAFNNTMRLKVKDLATNFTIDQIRSAESATLILEKLCKTDGSYRDFAKIMFGVDPKSAYDFRPTYFGGTYQPIKYAQVINTAGTENNIQGDITGSGLSSGVGNIGNMYCDDYGVFIGIMSIMPDTYYCQGLDKQDTYKTAEEFYIPDRAQLGKQAILNKELYNDPTDIDNEDVFGWQNRYDELRYRANEVHADLADENNISAKPYIQTRFFDNRPTLTPSFLTTENNIDDDWLSEEPSLHTPFLVQIGNKVTAIRPIPYRAEPATFGM